MSAFGILLLLAAVWVIVNANNIRQVLQGKMKFNLSSHPVSQSSTKKEG